MNLLKKLENANIFAILRAVSNERLMEVASALIDGGIGAIEVTFDQRGDGFETALAIESLTSKFGDRIVIGAGTVMTRRQAKLAHDAGAKFAVSPNTDADVIAYTKELGLFSMPGALTPTEIAHAYGCGADMVKLFPAGTMGPKYFDALRGPMPHIPLAAVGGITPTNIALFKASGAKAFGISSGLCSPGLVQQRRYNDITMNCVKFFNALNNTHTDDLG